MKVISLGFGVQSFTLAAMVALGELDPVDAAIFSDTHHEASWTYEFAKRWGPWLELHKVPVFTVFPAPGLSDPEQFVTKNSIQIPVYTRSITGRGQLRRQCTGKWKIAPIRRWLQTNRNRSLVELWIGISLDEFQRMKNSNVKYITHRWPLVELEMTRQDCVSWLSSHGLEVPGKSSCYFCPFHSDSDWRKIKNLAPEDWDSAVNLDHSVRRSLPPGDVYLSYSLKPLEKLDLRTDAERGQLSLWNNECSGMCGL